MTHKTQLILDDKQVVFLTNAAHMAVVILRAHPHVQNENDWLKALAYGFAAIEQTDLKTLRDTIIALQTASAEVVANSGGKVRAVTHEPEDSIEGLDKPFEM